MKRGSGNRSVMSSYIMLAKKLFLKRIAYSSVLLWLFQKRCEVLVSFLILIAGFSPFRDSLAMEDQYVEESVQQKDVGGLDRSRVEQDWLATILIESVGIQCGLDHNQRVADILVVENMPVEGSLIW